MSNASAIPRSVGHVAELLPVLETLETWQEALQRATRIAAHQPKGYKVLVADSVPADSFDEQMTKAMINDVHPADRAVHLQLVTEHIAAVRAMIDDAIDGEGGGPRFDAQDIALFKGMLGVLCSLQSRSRRAVETFLQTVGDDDNGVLVIEIHQHRGTAGTMEARFATDPSALNLRPPRARGPQGVPVDSSVEALP